MEGRCRGQVSARLADTGHQERDDQEHIGGDEDPVEPVIIGDDEAVIDQHCRKRGQHDGAVLAADRGQGQELP